MYIHYKADEQGRLISICPNGKNCLVGSGECIACTHFKAKEKKRKILKCKFRRKGTKNG